MRRVRFCAIVVGIISALADPLNAQAASRADIDRLTSYAVILGRAIACGIDTQEASVQIGKWMDKRFPPGSKDQQTYLPIFIDGVKYHAEQQRAGRSPDSCSQVRHSFSKMKWGG